ncbi:hypothetical protein CVT26_006288 [Gymnopilus dilepis]|uniref:Uncharacterized protein n=1 Tax=Gymnopilus dilepis TaxID=231916 RepID=A0A409X6J5_9AGAR|nr:hypothetical protein CVT26_006288 [Gymnopilus dilepis]
MPPEDETDPPVHAIRCKPFLLGFKCLIARNPYPGNQYFMAFGRAYGGCYTRILYSMNCTTCGPDKLELSENKRPLIWYDSDLERLGRERCLYPDPAGGGELDHLLRVQPPVVRLTGRKAFRCCEVREEECNGGVPVSGAREVPEVEILLEEERLAREA